MNPEMNENPPLCPVCNGRLIFLGTLGKIDHYRCRNCASDAHSYSPPPQKPVDEVGATAEDRRALAAQGIAWND